MSPGRHTAMWMILLEVEVPLVTRKVRSPPKRAALSCAILMLPVAEQAVQAPVVAEDSARNRLAP